MQDEYHNPYIRNGSFKTNMLFSLEYLYKILYKMNKQLYLSFLKIYNLECTKLLHSIVEKRGEYYFGNQFHRSVGTKSIFIHTTNISKNYLELFRFNCNKLFIINTKFFDKNMTYKSKTAFTIDFKYCYIRHLYLDSIYPGVRVKKDSHTFIMTTEKNNIKRINWKDYVPNYMTKKARLAKIQNLLANR